jgi:hypothetical protein
VLLLCSQFVSFMANVLQPHIDFGPRPASHVSSSFGFGFGLVGTPAASVMVAGWQLPPTPGHTNPLAFQQLATSLNQNTPLRPLKRRHEPQDDTETGRSARDHPMDRSPTPERPKKTAPKRARMAPILENSTRSETATKENKSQSAFIDDDIDAGVLLGQYLPLFCISLFSPKEPVFSKSPIRVTTSLINIATRCTTFLEIRSPTINPSTYRRHCHSRSGTVCQEAA